jgi:hypothetical protein
MGLSFFLRECVVAWHVWAPLGKAMAQGAWTVDVSSCFRRDHARGTLGPPVMISPRLMRHCLTLPCHHMARHEGGFVEAESTGKGSRVRPIPLQRVLRASRFAVCLKSQALARSALENARTMLTGYIHALDDSVMSCFQAGPRCRGPECGLMLQLCC